jgi:hypothetical protein
LHSFFEAPGSALPLPPKTDFEFISKFIRAKKYDSKAAVAAIERYYGNIFRNLDRFDGIQPSDVAPALLSNTYSLLRGRTGDEQTICFTTKNWDPQRLSLSELGSAAAFLIEDLLLDPGVQVSGGSFIFDLSGITMAHALHCTLGEVRKYVQTQMVKNILTCNI